MGRRGIEFLVAVRVLLAMDGAAGVAKSVETARCLRKVAMEAFATAGAPEDEFAGTDATAPAPFLFPLP